MIFTKSPGARAERLLAAILLLMLVLTVSAEARERHSENLVEIARRESEKRYAIAWWLNATGITKEYSAMDMGDIAPSTATKIYEEIFNRKIELFIGGYQLKYLKLLMCGNDTVEVNDISLLLTSFAKSVLEAPGNEHRVLLHKILFSALNPAEREKYKFDASDIDKLISLVVKLGERSNVDKRYVFSIVVKLQLIKLATGIGIYEDAYNELLNELLMKESILVALIVDRAIGDLQVNIVKREFAETLGLQRQLEQVAKNAPLTRSDVLEVLNYTMEMLQNAEKIANISIEELLFKVSTILGKNMNVEHLEDIIRYLGGIAGKNATAGTQPAGDRDENRTLLVGSAGSSTGEDDVRIGTRKYSYSASTTEEFEDAYHVSSAIFENAYFIESLSRLLEKINNEKIMLYIEFRNVDNTAINEKERFIYVVQEKAESAYLDYLQYTLTTLPLPLSLIIAYKKGILATIVNAIKEWATRKKPRIVAGLSSAMSKNEKIMFFEEFWNMVIRLSSKYNVPIAKSTTHREAFALLSSRIKDPSKIVVLEKLLYSYEYAKYGGVELDVKPLLQLINSLK